LAVDRGGLDRLQKTFAANAEQHTETPKRNNRLGHMGSGGFVASPSFRKRDV
jgi:hypothetical protein